MDRKLVAISVMCVTAVVLLVGNLIPLPTAQAQQAIKDRDFTIVTSRITSGGDGLYIVDNRSGMMAVFSWDPAARAIKLRDTKPVSDAFQ